MTILKVQINSPLPQIPSPFTSNYKDTNVSTPVNVLSSAMNSNSTIN